MLSYVALSYADQCLVLSEDEMRYPKWLKESGWSVPPKSYHHCHHCPNPALWWWQLPILCRRAKEWCSSYLKKTNFFMHHQKMFIAKVSESYEHVTDRRSPSDRRVYSDGSDSTKWEDLLSRAGATIGQNGANVAPLLCVASLRDQK